MDLKEIVCEGVDWICPAQDTDKIQSDMDNAANLLTSQATGSFSIRTVPHGDI